MKKIIIVAAIIIALIVAFFAGNKHGKMEIIRNGEFYIVDYNDGAVFGGKNYDTTLFIELDGNVYEAGLYIC